MKSLKSNKFEILEKKYLDIKHDKNQALNQALSFQVYVVVALSEMSEIDKKSEIKKQKTRLGQCFLFLISDVLLTTDVFDSTED